MIYDPVGRHIGGILFVAIAATLLLQDFLLQILSAITASLALTLAARMTYTLLHLCRECRSIGGQIHHSRQQWRGGNWTWANGSSSEQTPAHRACPEDDCTPNGYGILCTIVKNGTGFAASARHARGPELKACELQVRHSSSTPMPPPNLAAA
jgi:hypothetical protein